MIEIVGQTTAQLTPEEIKGVLINYIESNVELKVKSISFPIERKRDNEGDTYHSFGGAKIVFHEEVLCGKD